MSKAVFLDRDGVINEVLSDRVKYVNKPQDLYFLPSVKKAIKELHEAGYLLFVITNQGGVGLGYMTDQDLIDIHDKMVYELEKSGGKITEVKACVHHPHSGCACRKPKPGMILDLVKQYNIDVSKSYMIGDREVDLEAGNAAGLKSLMVSDQSDLAVQSFEDLGEAAEWIISQENS